jgi:hypothetical protein
MLASGPSRHVAWVELRCRDSQLVEECTPYPGMWLDRAVALASEFEAIREACAASGTDPRIKIISAYRTPEKNAGVGGAGKSLHLEGRALDVAPPFGMTLGEFRAVVFEQAQRRGIIRGIGYYPRDGHLHFDIRTETALAYWEE